MKEKSVCYLSKKFAIPPFVVGKEGWFSPNIYKFRRVTLFSTTNPRGSPILTQAKDGSTISAAPRYVLEKEEDPTNPKGDVLHCCIPIQDGGWQITSWRGFIGQEDILLLQWQHQGRLHCRDHLRPDPQGETTAWRTICRQSQRLQGQNEPQNRHFPSAEHILVGIHATKFSQFRHGAIPIEGHGSLMTNKLCRHHCYF
jgi:hypothetical protein